mmetsp:Transcript_18837/g.39014  ORF Transcript_18837/g.39014 Transcript_18837/m.39014 type:complete len:455 (-) Transcript_18837:153-1517(-)|eukprot:CAMPEP_0172438916 /NCGR_PEP_ID=MMETSP1065-20121228/37_1 /TAXON_ID=265537 /ORGANISM="Amphiprora paludosa, Strain CCMP125" /LENGTH=454 /DNA_ID=CAMNT_0013187513 /DNA_START=32 /DNA_END=1396 /DNA_ORIENTATION=-
MLRVVVPLFLSMAAVQATSFSANSAAGRKLLDKATLVEPHRRAADENQYGYLGSLSTSSIKYIGCSSYMTYDNDEEGGANAWANYQANQGNMNYDEENWWQYQMNANEDGLMPNNMVRFTLCEESRCGGSCSGEYVIDMESFVEAYTEWKMDHDYFWCERIRENCACNNGNSWYECYSDCFSYKGLSYDECRSAMNNYDGDGQNVFDIQQYLECSGIEFYNPQYMYQNAYNGNAFQYQKMYYLGLTCTNNDVTLTGFYDEQCSFRVDQSDLQSAMGSYQHIPYLEGTPILSAGTCMPCMDAEDEAQYSANYYKNQNANYNDAEEEADDGDNGQPDATDLCMMVTGQDGGNAIVCDDYNTVGCGYIQDYLPQMDGRGGSWNQALSSMANLRNQLTHSKRAMYFLAAVVAVLVGILAYFIGFWFTHRRSPKHRDALLEYRRETDAASSTTNKAELL